MPGVKKEQLEEAVKEVLLPLREIGRADLMRDDAVYFIGLMAVKGLAAFGHATLIMGADDKVCIADPTKVYLDAATAIADDTPDEELKFRYVRPILPTGRPQFVAWRDSELWEIEFTDEDESEEDAGRGDHS